MCVYQSFVNIFIAGVKIFERNNNTFVCNHNIYSCMYVCMYVQYVCYVLCVGARLRGERSWWVVEGRPLGLGRDFTITSPPLEIVYVGK